MADRRSTNTFDAANAARTARSRELPDLTGATYRQLDYWVRMGYINAGRPGSGYCRVWPDQEVRIARLMARLVAAGFTPAAAHRVARGGQIAPGITVLIGPEA